MLVTLAVLLSLSINTSFVIWTSSGLENPLYFFLTSLCCFVSLKYMMSENRNDSLRGGLVCACLALTRPEGIIFAFIFPMLTVMKNMQGGRINRSFGADSAFFLLGFLVPVGLYEAFRYVYFKDVLPNTYWVKGTGGFFQGSQCHSFADFLKKITNLLRSMILPPLRWPLFLSTALAAFFAFRGFNKSLLASLFLMTCGALSVYCLLPYDWMPHYRFATPFFLCFYLLVFVLAAAGLSSIRFLSENARQILFILLTAVFFSQSWLVYWLPAKLFSRAPTVRRNAFLS